MRELRGVKPIGLATVATAAMLALLVAGVGAVGLWAQHVNTWRSFFLLERVAVMAAPVALVLSATLLVTAAGLIARLR